MFSGGMLFVTVPGVVLVTQTCTRHNAPALMVAFDNVMTSVPVTAVRVAPGPQPADIVGPCELLMVTPSGRLSVKEKLVRVTSSGALKLKRNLEFSPASMVLGLNALFAVIPWPAVYTCTFADAGRMLVTPWFVVRELAGMVLVNVSVVASAGAVTWTVIVQVPGLLGLPAGIVPLVRVNVRGNSVGADPPQVVVAVPGTTVKTVPGSSSVMLTPVYGADVGFSSVMVSVVDPPAWKEEGENDFSTPTPCTFS
jgi:hypothetical protein